MKLKSTSRWRRILLRGTLIVLLVGVVGILLLSLSIELGVKKTCGMATRAHPGDKVEALMAFVITDTHVYDAHLYRRNNRAIWALGQLGDPRALPLLKGLATGQPCDHETNICQGEVCKAIQKLERNSCNFPAFVWRGALNY